MGLQAAGRDKLFLVFSDDIEWCKRQELFSALEWVAFVELGVDFLELRLMALCDHHIIANSTFRPAAVPARARPRRPRASRLRLTAQPPPPPPPLPLRTNRTRRVLHPVLIGHAASLAPY
jgi:hypothetical protein